MKINPADYKNWNDYYWNYQRILAEQYLKPMLDDAGINLNNRKILEIGCGNGGVIEAFAKDTSKAIGIDLRDFDRSEHATQNVSYITADVFDLEKRSLYSDKFDLIILRDVIEHLPDKDSIFNLFNDLLSDIGHVLITFPPFYSPFGAHQQVFSKTILGKLPYMHWMPKALYLKWVSFVEKKNQSAHDLAIEMENSKTTINQINRYIKNFGFSIARQHYFFVRPSYDIRYGYKPRKASFLMHCPVLREIFVLGVYMIIKKSVR